MMKAALFVLLTQYSVGGTSGNRFGSLLAHYSSKVRSLSHYTNDKVKSTESNAKATQRMLSHSEDLVMPSVFSKDESQYDTYAACLAATEGLRRIRDAQLLSDPAGSSSHKSSKVDIEAAAKYVERSVQVLDALGMPLSQYNEIGREIARDDTLREKVLEQAHLYRMATAIDLDQSIISNNAVAGKAGSPHFERGDFQKDKVDQFCQSVATIEKLRVRQLDRLAKALKVEKVPVLTTKLSDPNLLPFLSPNVRAVIEAFPYQAEAIVKQNGLDPNEFNTMLAEMNTNPEFFYAVRQAVKSRTSS